jgi:hypothetical protein
MKLKLSLVVALLAMNSNLSAANYYVNNAVNGDGTDVLMATSSGTLLNGGIVAIGYFTGGAPSSNLGDIATTIANFNQQTTAVTGSYISDLGGSYAGYYQNSTIFLGADVLVANPLIGQGVYLFAGNAATLAGSTEWALLQVGTFIADNPPAIIQYTADALVASTTPGNIVFGSLGSATDIFGTHTTFQLAAVPEPSAALLGALGALGLLRRRRI